jgi:catechol 2,3-dioxygenase-like lactoylglutathione lyase family enzyme
MDVQFVASVAPIVRDAHAARSFYRGALGLSFEGEAGDYLFTHRLEGTKHFGLWPLSEAAQACFGTTEWPEDVPVPQASIEFEVPDVAAAAAELAAGGYRLLHDARTEPWGQITARLSSPEGLLIAVCYTPAFHDVGTGPDVGSGG